MTIVLEAQKLTKIYEIGDHTIEAVKDVSLEASKGELTALVGPSGSGKTTLVAMLAGLLEPTEGSVVIDGQELASMSEGERARFRRERIGFTFQDNNLIAYLTARENVEIMLRLNGQANGEGTRRVTALFERLGLSDFVDNLPSQLSGGQQQRVAIARALIHEPAVILADEPTASLDTERAYQVVETLADLVHEQERTGIIVTHDLRLCRFTDRVIQLHDGAIDQVIETRAEIERLARPDESTAE